MLQALQNLDGSILLWIQDHLRAETLTPIVDFYTRLGEGGVIWIVFCLIMLLIPRTRRAGGVCLATMLLCYICNDLVIKNIVCRPRPFLTVPGLNTVTTLVPDSFSFPSGHSCVAAGVAVVWWRDLKGNAPTALRVVLVVLAVLMMLTRLYLGVHYPTDVLFGAVLGSVLGYFLCSGLNRLWDRRFPTAEKTE